eukprot:c50006_g1_i1 orf=36-239(-)
MEPLHVIEFQQLLLEKILNFFEYYPVSIFGHVLFPQHACFIGRHIPIANQVLVNKSQRRCPISTPSP